MTDGRSVTVKKSQTVKTMIKNILMTAVAVIIALIAYELGKNLLGLNSYEED